MPRYPNYDLSTIQKEILVRLMETDHALKEERKQFKMKYPSWIDNPGLDDAAPISYCLDLLLDSERRDIVKRILKLSWEKREINLSDIENAKTVWGAFSPLEIAENLHAGTFKDFCEKNMIDIDISGSAKTIRVLANISTDSPEILNGSIWEEHTIHDGTHRCLALTLIYLEKGNLLSVMGFFSMGSIKL